MAVFARNLVDTGMHPMAERNRLRHINSGRPGTLGESHRAYTAHEQEQGDRNQNSVHRFKFRSHRDLVSGVQLRPAQGGRMKCAAQVTGAAPAVNPNRKYGCIIRERSFFQDHKRKIN
jgi:hypothetical protein